MNKRTGILIVNLGTPDAPRTPGVRRYLRQFLSDPRVIDIPAIPRNLLLYLAILPFRPRQSAEAYRKIWSDRGSPLLAYSQDLAAAFRESLGSGIPVALSMRYGSPSIASGLQELRSQSVDRVVVFAVFPHYASSSTGSALAEVYEQAARLWNVPDLVTVPPFYDDPGFVRAFAEVGRPVLSDLNPDHVLMSYHGLPERQILKSDDTGRHCLKSGDCCAAMVEANRNCYRAQCYATSRALAAALKLPDDRWSVAFQSRLGRTPWIRPYTDEVLIELARRGVKRVAVYCPSFTADCLETLEEIGIRGRESFLESGGDELSLIPSLNSNPAWIEAALNLVRRSLPSSVAETLS